MRIVNPPAQVAHLFANQLQDEARTQTKNLFFYNDKIYSYGHHFCIARHFKGVLLFTERSYSNTTAKHISHVRNATSHKEKVFCAYPDLSHESNFSYWINEAEKNIDKLKRANKPIIYLTELDRIKDKAQKYAELMNVPINEHLATILAITDKEQAKEYESKKQAYLKAEKERKQKQLKKEHARALEKWRNFETAYIYQRDGFDYLRFNKEKQRFETSQRVEIPFEIAKRIYNNLIENKPFKNVLDYEVKEINKNFIQVGCHKITIKEINNVYKSI